MDLESADGSTIPIEKGSSTEIGRGLGLGFGPLSSDPTVSRRQLSLRLPDDASTDPDGGFRVSFEVIGRNPVLFRSSRGHERVYRRSEKGELEAGDSVSLSLKDPSFFLLKRRRGRAAASVEADKGVLDAVERRERRTMERRKGMEKEKDKVEGDTREEDSKEASASELEAELGALNLSQIDPVKEFRFLVRGHEFDQYPRRKIRAAKEWNWFLDEPVRESDSDDEEVMDEATSSKGKGRGSRKKKREDEEDKEWTGDSEDEKELATRGGSAKQPKHSIRSKDPKKLRNNDSVGRKLAPEIKGGKDELDEEDEEDETLGGFIVGEEEVDEQEEEEEEEELENEEESDDD